MRLPRCGVLRRCAFTALAAVVLVAGGREALAGPIAQGFGRQQADLAGERATIFTYRPDCEARALLILFHGRAGVRHTLSAARGFADRTCMIVVAPRFRTKSATYQQGGIVRRGEILDRATWTVNVITPLVDWARRQTGIDDHYLVGHSAGAQFLSRVAAFAPTAARRMVIANPSTYVLPSLDVRAPFGLGGVFPGSEGEAQLRGYLARPITIYLGEKDDSERAAGLNTGPDAMPQGRSRFERGMRTYEAGKALAASRGWAFNWRLVRVPDAGHDVRKMLSAEEMREAMQP